MLQNTKQVIFSLISQRPLVTTSTPEMINSISVIFTSLDYTEPAGSIAVELPSSSQVTSPSSKGTNKLKLCCNIIMMYQV